MTLWNDLREAALSGAFNKMSSIYLDRYEGEFACRRGHVLLLPFDEVGKPLVSTTDFAASVPQSRLQKHGDHQKQPDKFMADAQACAGHSHQHIVASGIMQQADGMHVSSVRDDLKLSNRQAARDIDVLAIKLWAPVSPDGLNFEQQARANANDAFFAAYSTVENMAHESAHAASRRLQLRGSRADTPLNFHTEEVRATVFAGFVSGQTFGPDMRWAMRQNCLNADEAVYHAPDTYRAAERWMLQGMQTQSPRESFYALSLPALLQVASHFAERKHQSPAQRETAKQRFMQMSEMERSGHYQPAQAAERLEQAKAQGYQAVYGKYEGIGPQRDRLLVLETPLALRYRRNLMQQNPLRQN